MSRTCFVIMPFSSTDTCTEEEWTWIFENVLKPAVEDAGLDYECRRSSATRGNIVADILRDLQEAYVVIADLTDRNVNVFYELGVRHSFSDRSIILAQRQEDIPFDLHAYAYHVYDWRTDTGRSELTRKVHQLLAEVDTNPDRSDNPVSDFLRLTSEPVERQMNISVEPEDVVTAQSLAGSGTDGLNSADFARRLVQSGSDRVVNQVLRLTRTELQPLMKTALGDLNQREVPRSVEKDQIPNLASEYISAIEPHVRNIEEFMLTCIELDWPLGPIMGIELAGDWISLSEREESGRVRLARGVPALLAWRLLLLMGSKAIADNAFKSLKVILKEPIQVEHLGGKFSHQPLTSRRDLFHPEAFLGGAYDAINYIKDLWVNQDHLHSFFLAEEEYYLNLGKFLIIVSLIDAANEQGHPLYPGYRLLPESRRAMDAFCSKLAGSESYLENIAKAIGESASYFRERWSKRAARANSAELGRQLFLSAGARFPDPMSAAVEEW